MKLTIFGATGKTGEHLVHEALKRGHIVTAFARTPSKLTIRHEQLEVVEGDITQSEKVADAIKGAEGVISAIGPIPGSPDDLMEKAAENILAGMKAHNVKRLIWAAGAGVTAPQDEPTGMHRVINFLLKLFAPKVLENSLRGVAVIKESDLDWTICRAPMLTDDPDRGNFRISYVNSNMGRALSRQNFAIFMLDMVESDTWIHDMPAASDK